MPNAKPVRIDGKHFDSARNAAAWLRGMGHPKASGAGISAAISSGRGLYLDHKVEWAPGSGPQVTRRESRHRLQWAGLPPDVRAELLAMSPEDLRQTAGWGSGARAIGAGLVLARGAEWLTQTEPVNPA